MEPGLLAASGALRGRGRPLCWDFARGRCRWGRSCRFLHAPKRGHCPSGRSFQHAREQPLPLGNRWGPEPGAWGWRGARSGSGPGAARTAFGHPSAEEEEEDKENVPAPSYPPAWAAYGEPVPARARRAAGPPRRGLRRDPNAPDRSKATVETAWAERSEGPSGQGAAAAPVPTAMLRARSEAVVCGICMERVYEKALPEERLFGILPNCGHAFCLRCIRTWRRSRDFQSTVIKACPECRVTSPYYIPHKYWVSEAGEKEELIERFKARTGKIRCKFFTRNRGRCPFGSDCIYLHQLPGGQPPQHGCQRPRAAPELSPSPSESSDEEEEFRLLEWAVTSALLETGLLRVGYGHEMLFGDSSDSD